MKKAILFILFLSMEFLANAFLYTNNVDGRVYDSSSGQYANSSWVFNNDMGWMGSSNAVANFSHSTFNNFCDYTSLASGPNANQTPSTVILAHSSGTIHFILPGSGFVDASHANLTHSVFGFLGGGGTTVDFSYANVANSTIHYGGIYHYTDVDNATITGYPISSRGVTGEPASLPNGVSLRNGIFFSDDQFNPSDHPNADFSFEAFNGTRFLGDYSGADFSGATFSNRGMDLAELSGTFTNANFSEAVFDGVVIDPNNASSFYGANFSGAVFSEDIYGGVGNLSYSISTFSNLVFGLVSNNCTLTHAVIPGFPDGYNGDPVYDFTNQASNFNAEVTTLEEDIIALEALVLSYSNQVESFSDVAAAESSGLSIIVAGLDDNVEDLTNTTAGQSNWISTTVVNWNSTLDDISEDVTTLDSQVTSLSNTVAETINDLVPGVDVITNNNGVITLGFSVKQSGDLESWDTLYDFGQVSIIATNDVKFYRLRQESQKGQ